MDPKKFYGSQARRQAVCVREIPDESDDSELSDDDNYNSDLDEAWRPENSDSSDESEQEETTDGECEEATSTVRPGPSRATVWCQMTSAADTPTEEPQFLGTPREPQAPKQPIQYFRDFINADVLQTIVMESNRYNLQCDITKPLSLTPNELEQFLGIIFYMSIVKIPCAHLCWNSTVRCPQIAETMPMKRFEDIKSKLHLHNNEENTPDKLAKVQLIIDAFREKVRSLPKSQKLSIDEQIVPFKSMSALKPYNPKKPKKWGYKIFVCSGVNGLIHDFEMYTGKINPCPSQPDIGASGNIVLRLLQGFAIRSTLIIGSIRCPCRQLSGNR